VGGENAETRRKLEVVMMDEVIESARLRGAEYVRPTAGRFDEDWGENERESGVLIVGRVCAGDGGI
jgi:hypothetical protein